MGLEPIRAFAHYPLKVARLPFRHNRMCNCWCSGTELNRRHGDFQSPALPTELPEQNMATPIGFEPTIFAVTGRHVKPLHHGAVSYFSERLAFRQKVFYHVPALLASTFFIIFAEHPFFFSNRPCNRKLSLCITPSIRPGRGKNGPAFPLTGGRLGFTLP